MGTGKRLTQLLGVVLMFTTSHHAATPSRAESTYREARKALDRGETARADRLIASVLGKAETCSDEFTCALLMLRAERYSRGDGTKQDAAVNIIKAELPTNARTSEAAVYRHILRGRRGKDGPAEFAKARDIATKHHPNLLPIVAISELGSKDIVPDHNVDAVAKAVIAQAGGDATIEPRVNAARAYRLTQQQRFVEAIATYEKAIELARERQLLPTLANAEGNLGWAYIELGDYETAAEYFARADSTFRKAEMLADGLAYVVQLGNVALQQRDEATAARRFQEVLDVMREGTHAAHALQNLSRLALKDGRIEEAKRRHREAFALKTKLDEQQKKRRTNAQNTTRETEDDLARAVIVEGEIATAERRFGDAKATLERVPSQTKNKAIQWEARAELAQVYVAMKRDDLAEAQFLDAIRTVGEARRKIDRDLRLAFLTRATNVMTAYVEFLVARGRDDDALRAVDAYRVQTLEEELGVIRPRTFDPRAMARNANATILSYWLGEDRSYLWVVTANTVKLHRVDANDATINAAADAYQRELRGRRGTLAQSGAKGQALYRMLVEPAGPFARDARVVVVPDGRLHNINFETLVVPSPKPHYWAADVIVTNAGSLQMLAGAPAKAPPSPSMLLFGDPLPADAAFRQLDYAAGELDAIAQQFPQRKVFRREKATPSAYLTAKPESFDYLHFVAHGVATQRKPLESAIILTRNNDKEKSYRLSAKDIVKRPLQARLVTISSCYGAGSRAYSGEGLVGLAWAFLSVGADQVIAALWDVDDQSTAELMKEMYAGIRRGDDPAVALRAAKLQFINSGTLRAKPSYWAPFVLYDGR